MTPHGLAAADDLGLTLHLLRLEGLAVEVSRALDEAGAPALLLKGPVTNRWLYDAPDARPYGDIDLLVRPRDAAAAAEVLAGLGFRDAHATKLGVHRPDNETAWVRDDLVVDLHTRLVGVPRSAGAAVADEQFAAAEVFGLQGHEVRSLGEVDRVVHVALHAAQSKDDRKAERDLERAMTVVPRPVWVAARQRASELGSGSAFALGLSTVPEGAALLDAWGSTPEPSLEAAVRASGAVVEATAIVSVWQAPRGTRLAEVRGWLTPQVTGARTWWDRVAATGRLLLGVVQIARVVLRRRLSGTRPQRTMSQPSGD